MKRQFAKCTKHEKKVDFFHESNQARMQSDDPSQDEQNNTMSVQEDIRLCCVCLSECGGAHSCLQCKQFVHVICGTTQGEEGFGSKLKCNNCLKKDQFDKIRSDVTKNTERQAKRMLQRSSRKFPSVQIDDNVIVPIPSVDRSKCEFQNLIGIILGKDDDLYTIGCRAGWIKEKFGRNGFEKCPSKFLTKEDIPRVCVTLRSASTMISIDGKAQGMFKCNCKKTCLVGRCKCKSAALLCNSKCHNSSSCDNK
jgi:hypothetical protein